MSDPLKPGDVIDGRWVIERGPIAIQGLEGCEDGRCTRVGGDWSKGDMGRCAGYHCPDCLTPTSMYGHECPERGEVTDAR